MAHIRDQPDDKYEDDDELYAEQDRKKSLSVDEAIKMFGERVLQVRVYERQPKADSPARSYGLLHRALVCKTDAGNEYLVHNGPGGCGHIEGDAVILLLKSTLIEEQHWQPVHSDDKSEADLNDWITVRDGVTMSKVKAAASSSHFNKLTYNCNQVVKNVLDWILPRKSIDIAGASNSGTNE